MIVSLSSVVVVVVVVVILPPLLLLSLLLGRFNVAETAVAAVLLSARREKELGI